MTNIGSPQSVHDVASTITTDDLQSTETEAYHPVADFTWFNWLNTSLPLFSFRMIERMLYHPQVRLGVGVKAAPLLRPKFTIKASSPEIAEFVGETLRAVWRQVMPDLARHGLAYGIIGGECVYDFDRRTRLWKFHRFHEVHPIDFRILTRGPDKYGIRITPYSGASVKSKNGKPHIDLLGPKSFLYVHNRRWGKWDGESDLFPAYEPWWDQVSEGGSRQILRLWYWKNAFDSGILRYPVGQTTNDERPGGGLVSNRDKARQVLDMIRTGGSVPLPNSRDDKGNPLWEFERPEMNSDGGGLIGYQDHLDVRIMRGIGIPDDVVSQTSGTGSFAGRTIPLASFFESMGLVLGKIADCVDRQIVSALVKINFGSEAWYEITNVEVDVDGLMPSTVGAGEGVAGAPGAPGAAGGEGQSTTENSSMGNGPAPNGAPRLVPNGTSYHNANALPVLFSRLPRFTDDVERSGWLAAAENVAAAPVYSYSVTRERFSLAGVSRF